MNFSNAAKRIAFSASLLFLGYSYNSVHAQEKVYLVGSEASYPPYEYLDANGQVAGMDVDILTAATKSVGMEIKFINTAWNNLNWVDTLNNGSRDIWASGIAVKDDRKELITYTDPYYTTYTVVFVREDNEKVSHVNTLEGMRDFVLATQKNTVDYQQTAEAFGLTSTDHDCRVESENLVATDTQFLAYKDLLQGKVDGVTGNITVGQYLLKPYLDKSGIKVRTFNASASGEEIQLAFAVKKGNTELAERINEGLAKIRANGEYDRILRKWLGDIK